MPGMLLSSLREITSVVLSANRILRVRSSSQVKATSLCEFFIILRPGVAMEPQNFRYCEERVIYPPLVPCVAAMPAMVARSPKRGAPLMITMVMAPVIILILLSLNRNIISFVFPFTNSDDAICIKCRKELSFRDSSEVLHFTCYRVEVQLLLSSTSAHSSVLACSSDSLPRKCFVFQPHKEGIFSGVVGYILINIKIFYLCIGDQFSSNLGVVEIPIASFRYRVIQRQW